MTNKQLSELNDKMTQLGKIEYDLEKLRKHMPTRWSASGGDVVINTDTLFVFIDGVEEHIKKLEGELDDIIIRIGKELSESRN